MNMYEVFIRVVVSGRFWRKNGSVSDMVCGDTITETDRDTHTDTQGGTTPENHVAFSVFVRHGPGSH